MSVDPLSGSIGNPQSLNRFAYVLNNPANLVDPFGLEDCVQASDGSWIKKDGTPCTASGDPDNPNLIPGGSVTVNGGDGGSNHNPMNEPAGSVSWDGTWHCFYLSPCVNTAGTGGVAASKANADPTLDNRTRALAKAINNTGVQAVANPCSYVGWTAAAAALATGGVAVVRAGEIVEAIAENSTTIYTRVLNWWFNQTSRPGKPGLARATVAAAAAAKDAVVSTCNQF